MIGEVEKIDLLQTEEPAVLGVYEKFMKRAGVEFFKYRFQV